MDPTAQRGVVEPTPLIRSRASGVPIENADRRIRRSNGKQRCIRSRKVLRGSASGHIDENDSLHRLRCKRGNHLLQLCIKRIGIIVVTQFYDCDCWCWKCIHNTDAVEI